MHFDGQLGFWWSNGWNTGKVHHYRSYTVSSARHHHRAHLAHLPRVRGPICGAVWACKGNGHVTSGMTPEEAYSKWLAWQGGV